MALFRYCIIAICLCVYHAGFAQQIYYPAGSSQLLQATALDMAMLLKKATGNTYAVQQYTAKPTAGIVYTYDSSFTDNQACRVKSDGRSYLVFSAAEDNGLIYGIYRYLNQLGYRFYQPGELWETTPQLSSAYSKTDTLYTCAFKYKTWFLSGGYNKWLMDDDDSYNWDLYPGKNGHDWSLYRRRNNMLGANRFAGHREDVISAGYLNTLSENPCYVAPFNGSRQASIQSVPDINNTAAMKLWADAIEQKYTQYANTIYGKKEIYTNFYRNFNYNNQYIGIEVADGAHWANSVSNTCSSSLLLKPSDQQFTLANFTVATINKTYPGKHFQLYAYDSHADVPSASINISDKIDVQVIPGVYQNETSPLALLTRWYNRHKNISEYHYLNLASWSGETPAFNFSEVENTIQRLKKNKSQGIVWETAPAKFSTLPFLLAANESLVSNKNIDDVLKEFSNNLFGKASALVYDLLKLWSDDKTFTLSNGLQDYRYKLPLYFDMVNNASALSSDDVLVNRRLLELKAFLHYMVLYYDWVMDQRAPVAKTKKAAVLCEYLARVHHLKLVNSYAVIQTIVNSYTKTDNIYASYNTLDGTAYLNGTLPLITEAEIRKQFEDDYNEQKLYAKDFIFLDAATVKNSFIKNNLIPLDKINVKLSYTFGKDYYSSTKYFFLAPAAGSISIKYMPKFDMPDNGYINFTVESVDDQTVVKDFSLNNKSSHAVLNITIPAAGNYILTISSKYKSSVDLSITTNGNFFYTTGTSFSNVVEIYQNEPASFPGYFYIPEGVSKLYFDVNNSNPGGNGFTKPEDIAAAFAFKNNEGKLQEVKLVSANDSAFFYIDVPSANSGSFWTASKNTNLRLGLSNISNIWWFANRKTCDEFNFKAAVIKKGGDCITTLTTTKNLPGNKWEIIDGHQTYNFSNQQLVELPAYLSPTAVVTLIDANQCAVTRRLLDDADYIKQKSSCALGATLPLGSSEVIIYPNPGNGVYRFRKQTETITADEITVFNASGNKVGYFTNTREIDLTKLNGGVYFYQLVINKNAYRGKLIKQ